MLYNNMIKTTYRYNTILVLNPLNTRTFSSTSTLYLLGDPDNNDRNTENDANNEQDIQQNNLPINQPINEQAQRDHEELIGLAQNTLDSVSGQAQTTMEGYLPTDEQWAQFEALQSEYDDKVDALEEELLSLDRNNPGNVPRAADIVQEIFAVHNQFIDYVDELTMEIEPAEHNRYDSDESGSDSESEPGSGSAPSNGPPTSMNRLEDGTPSLDSPVFSTVYQTIYNLLFGSKPDNKPSNIDFVLDIQQCEGYDFTDDVE